MRDDLEGAALATLIAAPVMIVCCGGASVALTAITGAVGGWFGGVATMSVAAVSALTWRSLRRARSSWCDPNGNSVVGAH